MSSRKGLLEGLMEPTRDESAKESEEGLPGRGQKHEERVITEDKRGDNYRRRKWSAMSNATRKSRKIRSKVAIQCGCTGSPGSPVV